MDSEYITRLHLLKTPWFAICLHWINKPDPEPFLHDHPVTFLSIVLRGWYEEARFKTSSGFIHKAWWPKQVVKRKWFNWVRASESDRHSICRVAPHTLTLCFMGPKRREWGFHTDKGWVYWRDYYAAQRVERGKEVFFKTAAEEARGADDAGTAPAA